MTAPVPRRGLGPKVDAPGSLSRSLRDRRFKRFLSLLEGPSEPRIVDLGGTVQFWGERAAQGSIARGEVVLVNLHGQSGGPANVTTIEGDVTSLSQFPDMSFDAVFSNSVIEHVGSYEEQAAMAREVRRLAPIYSVQTPNYWFPLEPHFLVPGWQWLPVSVRIALVRTLPLGRTGRRSPDAATARQRVESIRLLRRTEMEKLFPDGRVLSERIGPLLKSWTVERGFVDGVGAAS
jgi:hypothetical protein